MKQSHADCILGRHGDHGTHWQRVTAASLGRHLGRGLKEESQPRKHLEEEVQDTGIGSLGIKEFGEGWGDSSVRKILAMPG